MEGRLRIVRGGNLPGKLEVPITPEVLREVGEIFVAAFAREARKDFAKRGWSGESPEGGPPIWESFSYRLLGESSVEVVCSYPGMVELTKRARPAQKMTWLTQEQKEKYPSRFALTRRERKLKMKRGGRVSKGKRLPLVVPMQEGNGQVVFRTAPLTTADAWIHPGIARFTFPERAAKAAREEILEVVKREAFKALVKGLSNGRG